MLVAKKLTEAIIGCAIDVHNRMNLNVKKKKKNIYHGGTENTEIRERNACS